MKRVLSITIILIFFLLSFNNNYTYANYVNNEVENLDTGALYNLSEGGTQEFKIKNKNGEEVILTIEEISPTLNSVDSGTYKVTASTTQWEAGYKISVSNNEISSAYGGYHKAYIGSFTSARLSLDNSKQSTYYLKRKVGIVRYSIDLRAEIVGDEISVSY